jgi:hypothetical protein
MVSIAQSGISKSPAKMMLGEGAYVSHPQRPHSTFTHHDPFHGHFTLIPTDPTVTLTLTSKKVHAANYNKENKPWRDEEHFSKFVLFKNSFFSTPQCTGYPAIS